MEPIEIRLLGPTRVRRADGTAVDPQEWRTCKSLDLLRLLALHNGEPVPVPTIIDKLWPDVDEARGRASLRTAASQLRKTLDADCLDRLEGAVVLRGAWVDAQAFESLVDDAEASRRAGDRARTVALAQEAESLYVGDLATSDASGDWIFSWHERFRRLRCRLLLDAADAAAGLCWMRDSLDFAERAHAIDACERSARALMRAHAGVGEIERALEVFDRTCRDLATRYGVDPSPQTRALHLQLVTGTAARDRAVGLVGHEETVDGLAMTLTTMLRSDAGVGIVWLEGEPGSGRDSVVASACRQAGLSMHDMGRDAWLHGEQAVPSSAAALPDTDVVVMPHAESAPPHATKMLDALARKQGGVLVVPLHHAPEEGDRPQVTVPHAVVQVRPLNQGDLAELAEAVLQGTPSTRLLRRLRAASAGLSGVACRTATSWLEDGRVVWTVDGLELTEATPAGDLAAVPGLVHRQLRTLSGFAEDVIHVVAVAGRAVEAETVAVVVLAVRQGGSAGEVSETLDDLVDAGLLTTGPGGYRLRDRRTQAELLAWMRPRLRRQLHLVFAERVSMPLVSRLRHLVAAGEQREASMLGTAALEQARARGDVRQAQELVQVLVDLPLDPAEAALPRQVGIRDLRPVPDGPVLVSLRGRAAAVAAQSRERLYSVAGMALTSELESLAKLLAG